MNKIIKIIILLIFTVWQLKSETLELTKDEKNVLNSFFKNETEYFTILGEISFFFNCQTNYIDYISEEFKTKSKIKFSYTLGVDAKNDSYSLKNQNKISYFNEVLNKKFKFLNKKQSFYFIYYRNENYTIYEIATLKDFFDNELKYFTNNLQELKYIKTIEDYDKEKPIISLINIDDSIFTDFYNYDILKLDSNFNLKYECNFTNQIYSEDFDNDGINETRMTPILSTVHSFKDNVILDYSLFVASENDKYYGFHTIFKYDCVTLNEKLYKLKNTNAIIGCLYNESNLFLLNDFNQNGNIDNKTLIYNFNQRTLMEESWLNVSNLKKNKKSKNKLKINKLNINNDYMFLIDYDNEEYYKLKMNNFKEQKIIPYSKFLKNFKSNFDFDFDSQDKSYFIYFINHSLIIKEQYAYDTDTLIKRNVYKLPSNLSTSDIIYFLEFKRNDKIYYMLKTNDVGFVLLEQP